MGRGWGGKGAQGQREGGMREREKPISNTIDRGREGAQ